MKNRLTILAFALAVAVPAAACAQTVTEAVAPEATEVPPDVAAVYLDPDQRIEQAEEVLREVIASGQTGDFTHPLMSERLLTSWTPQIPQFKPLLDSFGALVTIESTGLVREAESFQVTFENAITDWRIGFEDDGKIGLLMFRKAPPPADPNAPITLNQSAFGDPARPTPRPAVPPPPTADQPDNQD